MEKNNYIVPSNKKQLIEYINEAGISDIICSSSDLDNCVQFGIELQTKDDKSFFFIQDLETRFKFKNMEVLDFSTGNGYDVPVNLGSVFNPKKYKYRDNSWSLKNA